MRKVKRASHPMRYIAVRLLMRGEATPAEIVKAVGVSRQLVRYWCKAAGVQKVAEARAAHIRGLLIRGMSTAPGIGAKARMRKAGERAKAQWDKRHANGA